MTLLPPIPVPPYDPEKKRLNEDRSAARWSKRGETQGYPCIVCGTFTGPNPAMLIHVCGGGGEIHDANEVHATAEEEAGCLAFYPVGGSCLKRFPQLRRYAIRQTPEPPAVRS